MKLYRILQVAISLLLGTILACLLSLLCVACMVGCSKSNTADAKQAAETEDRLREAFSQVGMPDITKFTELKLARDILELRDKELTTYTYVINMHGDFIYLGESIGYGLPYSVQFSNPEHTKHYGGGDYGTVPQAEPNGLFMPDGLSATWVMLKGPDGVHPVYVESEILVTPFRLTHLEK